MLHMGMSPKTFLTDESTPREYFNDVFSTNKKIRVIILVLKCFH